MNLRDSILSNIFHGSRILDRLVPWNVIVNHEKKTLLIKKKTPKNLRVIV